MGDSSFRGALSGELGDEYWHLLFGVRRSVRYHDRRRGFYESFHTVVVFLSVIGGSATIAAFSTAVGSHFPLWLKLLPAALITVLSGLDLVLGSVRKAWLHADLERRFVELERYLSAGPESAALVSEGWDRRLAIEVDEPPVLKVLDAMCHNELLRSERYPKEAQVPISVWQRFFAHWFDFQEHTIQPQT